MKEVQNYVWSRPEFYLVWRNKTNCKPRTEFHVSFIAANCFIKKNASSIQATWRNQIFHIIRNCYLFRAGLPEVKCKVLPSVTWQKCWYEDSLRKCILSLEFKPVNKIHVPEGVSNKSNNICCHAKLCSVGCFEHFTW